MRDATTKGALQPTYTLADSTAKSILGTDAASFRGVSFSNTKTFIVQIDSANNSELISDGTNPWSANPVPASDGTGKPYVYLFRVSTQAAVDPIMNMTGSPISGIPGLTSPMNLNFTYQVSAENTQGLCK